MVLVRWKTAAYKGCSAARRLAEVLVEVEASTTPGKEEDFKPQKANAKRGSTSYTNLGTIWKLLRPSWGPHPHASLIKVTERVRLLPAKDEDLGNLNVVHKLILTHQGESEGATSKLDKLVKKMEPGSCLDLACGGGEHSCDGRSCVRIQSFQREGLATWFGDITEKEKSEEKIVTEC